MPKYNKNSPIAKAGLNYFRTIIEKDSLFHKIEQENDLGIDAIIEFVKDQIPTNISIAVQIKSGKSYYDEESKKCKIPVDDHYNYWKNYSLPVYGFVYVPDVETGYWVNIKNYIQEHKNCSIIQFEANEYSKFDLSQYKKIFFPVINNELPVLSIDEAREYFLSQNHSLRSIGTTVLFRRYVNNKLTWKLFLDYFEDEIILNIPNQLIYYISHIPWHPDIYHSGESINEEIKNICKSRIKDYDVKMISKLLNNIDESEGIQRGSIGQSIEAIISIIDDIKAKLYEIISDDTEKKSVRIFAIMIFAMHYPKDSLAMLKKFDDLENVADILQFVEKFGEFELYI